MVERSWDPTIPDDQAMSAERIRVRGVTIYRSIIYGNTATVLTAKERETAHPEHTHRWTVAVRSAATESDSDIVGGADDLGHFIKRVTFKLHETYPNPTRNVDRPPFEVTETGWGEFEIQIRITFIPESGEKALTLYHHLKLHPWTLSGDPEIPPLDVAIKHGPIHSWQYDEIVFHDPFQSFLTILTTVTPTSLPKSRRRPVPFHTANATAEALEASRGGVPEFTLLMEKEEHDRLEQARRAISAEQERWRLILGEREKELEQLQKLLSSS